jgi:hypothetical protein
MTPVESHDATSAECFGRRPAQLKEALTTRMVIGQATGIIGGRLQIETATAWEILRRRTTTSSARSHRSSASPSVTAEGEAGMCTGWTAPGPGRGRRRCGRRSP